MRNADDAEAGPMPFEAKPSGALPQRWFGVQQASEYMGIGVASVRRLISAGKLTAYRVLRGRVLLDKFEIDSLVLGSSRQLRGPRRGHTNSKRTRG